MSRAARVAVERKNPFPGLRPFREDEEHLFFGRENQVDAMVDKLARTRFLAVVGTSGSGKSSLVNCGLRPALHRGLMARGGTSWRVAQFRPGSRPIRQMTGALAQDGVLFRGHDSSGLTLSEIVETTLRMSSLGLADIYRQARLGEDVNLLVVVDQFEELFRYRWPGAGDGGPAAGGDEEATAFVNLLLEAARQPTLPIYVVLTMRSDFLGDCAEFGGLAEAINDSQYLIPRLTRDERRAVIQRPIRLRGAEISPVLLTRLVNDVGDNPDQLSILQHALNRTWECWETERGAAGPLDLEVYRRIGTMKDALDLHAEKAYAELRTPRQRQICERLFKTLTDKATDPRGIRRATRLGALCAVARATEAEVSEVIAVFRQPSRSFLMPPMERPREKPAERPSEPPVEEPPGPGAAGDLGPETDIDISHESLMRVWKRLQGWAEEERRSAEQYLLLARDAERHRDGQVELLRQPALGLFVEWRRDNAPTEAWAELYKPTPDGRGESYFAQAMRYLDASERHEKARRRKKLWSVVGAFALLAVVAAVILFLYFQAEEQRREAERQRALTEEQKYLSDIRLARAELARDEAVRASEALWRAPESRRNWEWGYLLRKSYSQELAVAEAEGELVDAAFSPASSRPRIAAASAAGAVTLWDALSGEVLLAKPLEACDPDVWTGVRFSADGARLLTVCDKPAGGDEPGPTRVWDAATGELLAEIEWRREVGEVLFGGGRVLAFAPVDAGDAAGGSRLETWAWDAAGPAATPRPLPSAQGVSAAAFCGSDGRLATGSPAGGIELWDLAVPEGSPVAVSDAHDQKVWAVACSPDGARLISGSADGTARVWNVAATGSGRPELLDTLPHPDSFVTHVALSADGALALTVAGDEARVWVVGESSVETREAAAVLSDVEVDRAAFGSDGSQVLAEGFGQAVLWNWAAAEGSSRRVFKTAQADAVQAAFGPGDSLLLTRFPGARAVRVWRTSPSLVDACWELDARVLAAEPTADGVRAVTRDGEVVVRRSAGCPAAGAAPPEAGSDGGAFALEGHDKKIRVAAFSGDGGTLVTASSDATQVWAAGAPEAGGWKPTLRLPPIGRVQRAALSSDGARLVLATADPKRASIWDTAVSSKDPIAQTGKHPAPVDSEDPLPLAQTGEHPAPVDHVAFDPSGRRVVTGCQDGTARVWDAATGELQVELPADDGPVVFAAFSPDGQRVVTAAGSLARVWSAASGALESSLAGHREPLTWAGFSPDGSRIFTASEDGGTVRIWDPRGPQGAELAVLDGLRSPFEVRFASAPSRLLVVGNRERLELLTVFPFRREDLPGDPPASWEERIGRFQRDLARAADPARRGG